MRQLHVFVVVLALAPAMSNAQSPADSLYTLGLQEARQGRHARSAELWEKAVAADPRHVDARYNLGQYHQIRGVAAKQLEHFLAAYKLTPDDLEIAKKVLQSYYRLEQYDRAAAFRAKVLEIIRTSKDPRVAATKEFCFDQFPVGEERIYAYETVNPKGDLYYVYRFRVTRDEKPLRSINLESSSVARELGTPYLLGQDTPDGKHTTFGVGWKAMPRYDELKRAVLAAHGGKMGPASTSAPRR